MMNSLMDDLTAMQANMTRSELNAVIMNYLVTEGYQEASQLFKVEANIEPDAALEPVEVRVQVREALYKGQITNAILLLNEYYPEVLGNNHDLCFRLQLQHLVELIRAGQCDAALEFAQTYLAEHGQRNPELLGDLERAMALLAFQDPFDSPFADVLLETQRYKLASQVNSSILNSANLPSTSKIELFYKLMLWVHHELDSNKIRYECVQDIASCAKEDLN